jgi:hypothetical protein
MNTAYAEFLTQLARAIGFEDDLLVNNIDVVLSDIGVDSALAIDLLLALDDLGLNVDELSRVRELTPRDLCVRYAARGT